MNTIRELIEKLMVQLRAVENRKDKEPADKDEALRLAIQIHGLIRGG